MSVTLEKKEDESLAPCAMKNVFHGGRFHPEDPPPYRTAFQRDRDRIIHSKAFRRLGYKTQVFVNTEGDNYRTRLTHSIEVGQLSRSVAAALRLNRDYAETIALAHDLGHTPFGHAGQQILHSLLREKGGFEHNCQSLRIVTALEMRYPLFRGLNLTRATLKGMMKHSRIYECDRELEDLVRERKSENPSLEAALVDHCDRIAYIHHDLEDGMDSNILQSEELFELDPWRDTYRRLEQKHGRDFSGQRISVRIRSVVRSLINLCILDLIATTEANIATLGATGLADILVAGGQEHPVRFSAEMAEILAVLQKHLVFRLYRHPRVMQMSRRGKRIIERLFLDYSEQPEMLPDHFRQRIEQEGQARVVADYVSGMTDRFALREYRFLTGAAD